MNAALLASNPIIRGNVVEVTAARNRGANRSEFAVCGIIWKIEGKDVLWIPVTNARAEEGAKVQEWTMAKRHRSDIAVSGMTDHAACGFNCPRPVIECRKLLRRPLSMFDRKRALGTVPDALMARIGAAQMQEARRLRDEIRLVA